MGESEFGDCPLCGDPIDHCNGHGADDAEALYFAEVAQAARAMCEPLTDDVIAAAFGMVEVPDFIDATTEPTGDEIAAVRASLGIS